MFLLYMVAALVIFSIWRPHLMWYPLMDRLVYPSWLIYHYKLATPLSYELSKNAIMYTMIARIGNRQYPCRLYDHGYMDPRATQLEHLAALQTKRQAEAIQAIMDRVESRMCL